MSFSVLWNVLRFTQLSRLSVRA